MRSTDNQLSWTNIVSFGCLFLGCFLLGTSLASILVGSIFSVDIADVLTRYNEPLTGKEIHALRLSILLGNIIRFILPVVLYYSFIAKRSFTADIKWKQSIAFRPTIFMLFALLQTYVIAYKLQEINMLVDVGETMKKMEEASEAIVNHFMSQRDILSSVLNFLTIAVMAGVGEELIFRGLIQKGFAKITRSPHAAIWISAFLFSLMHMEMEGFLPRLFLGGVFGFIYYYSKNIWYPIIIHIVFNGITLVGYYMYSEGKTDIDLQNPPVIDTLTLLQAIVIFSLAMFLFKRYFDLKKNKEVLDD